MRLFSMRAFGWRIAIAIAFMGLSCGLMAFASMPETRAQRRVEAQEIWSAHPLRSYRIVIQASFSGRACMQEIEAHNTIFSALRDTCDSPWLASMTVDRLFELTKRLEAAPECFPSAKQCICQRVRIGTVQYDSELGFPVSIVWRRELRPNWQHPAYWRSVWETHSLPKCSMPSRALKLDVVSLIALEQP